MRGKYDESAVSPVIGVILMVAITVVLAGILYLWAIQLTDHDEGELTHYSFEFELDSDGDEILMELKSGPVISSTYFMIKIDGQIGSIPEQNFKAGETIHIPSPFDLTAGSTYTVKLIKNELVVWDQDYIAKDL